MWDRACDERAILCVRDSCLFMDLINYLFGLGWWIASNEDGEIA